MKLRVLAAAGRHGHGLDTTLAPNTRYTVTLTGGATAIRDTAGAALSTMSWSFTTGA